MNQQKSHLICIFHLPRPRAFSTINSQCNFNIRHSYLDNPHIYCHPNKDQFHIRNKKCWTSCSLIFCSLSKQFFRSNVIQVPVYIENNTMSIVTSTANLNNIEHNFIDKVCILPNLYILLDIFLIHFSHDRTNIVNEMS